MRSIGIRQQLLLLALLPLLVVTAGTGLLVLYQYHVELEVLQERQTLRAARMLARLAAPVIQTNDINHLQSLIDSSIDKDINGVQILTPQGEQIASSGANQPVAAGQATIQWQADQLSAKIPIYRYSHTSQALPEASNSGPLLGWVVLTSNPRSLSHYRYETVTLSLLCILLALVIASFLGGNISKVITNQLRVLRNILGNLDSHEWSTRLPPSGNEDWQSLREILNDLAHRTQQHIRHLQNQVDHSHHDLQRTLESLEISNIELELARKEALSASQSKSEFLANTSHEVRTPLTGILGFCKVLLQSETNPRKREYLETIRRSAEHLLGILNDVLDLSKIEAGKFSLDYTAFDLLPTIEDSVCLFAPQAADKGIDLIIDVRDPIPLQVMGDAVRIKQLIANLVSNAVKFTDSGQVKVTLDAKPIGEHRCELGIEVADTGMGIEKNEQRLLFKAFQQIDASSSRRQEGTGLGLAIVRNLVKQMNGTLNLESERGIGTNFSISLPLECISPPEPQAKLPLRYPKALVWEPNYDSRAALCRRLQRHGIDVVILEELSALESLLPIPEDSKLLLGLSHESELHNLAYTLPAGQTTILLPTLSGVLSRRDYDFLQKPATDAQLLAQFQLETANSQVSYFAEPAANASKAATLVVDDNPNNRLLLEILLEDAGGHCDQCSNGAEALVLCEQKHYPLILLDLQMPGMSGSEVANRIRQSTLNSQSHIVALTAHSSRDAVAADQLLDFDDFITKPADPETLRELLRFCEIETLPPINISECLQKCAQRAELAKQLLMKFLEALPAVQTQWQHSISGSDIDQVRELTHQLQGACAYVSTPRLGKALTTFQSLLKRQVSWDDGIARHAQSIVLEMDTLLVWQNEHDLDVIFEIEPLTD